MMQNTGCGRAESGSWFDYYFFKLLVVLHLTFFRISIPVPRLGLDFDCDYQFGIYFVA